MLLQPQLGHSGLSEAELGTSHCRMLLSQQGLLGALGSETWGCLAQFPECCFHLAEV